MSYFLNAARMLSASNSFAWARAGLIGCLGLICLGLSTKANAQSVAAPSPSVMPPASVSQQATAAASAPPITSAENVPAQTELPVSSTANGTATTWHAVGPVVIRYVGIHAYDAQLWVPDRFSLSQYRQHNMRLQLHFARDFLASDLARRASKKMAKAAHWNQNTQSQWRDQLQRLMPNIHAGDTLLISYQVGKSLALSLNNKPLGSIGDAQFAELYMGLWLSPHPADDGIRQVLAHHPLYGR